METEISYKKAMETIWNIKTNMDKQFMEEYSSFNHEVREIIQSNTPTPIKEKKILELFIKFTRTHKIHSSFMSKLGFYKRGMENDLIIIPKL